MWSVIYLLYLWVQKEAEDFNSNKLLTLVGCPLEYSLLNQPIKVLVLT